MRYWKGMLPRTDALLNRSINIGIGVDDPGLGSAFGVTMRDGLDVVEQRATRFRQVARQHLMHHSTSGGVNPRRGAGPPG